jgi:short-subunit dehydrogenase
MPTALITGASAGLGHAFARHLADRSHDLVLVARDERRLEQVAAPAREAGRDVEVIVADLSTIEGCGHVERRISDGDIDLLINNAGSTTAQPFPGSDLDAKQAELDLMVRTTMRLTHAALPPMLDRRRGGVLNVSSIAAWMPGGTYSAAKAWVTTFTESLAVELQGTGVHATALCPGLVHTEFHDRAALDVSRFPEAMWLDADDVVEAGLRDLSRGRPISVPGVLYGAARRGLQFSPHAVKRRVVSARPRSRGF